jgi:hypothetical protein
VAIVGLGAGQALCLLGSNSVKSRRIRSSARLVCHGLAGLPWLRRIRFSNMASGHGTMGANAFDVYKLTSHTTKKEKCNEGNKNDSTTRYLAAYFQPGTLGLQPRRGQSNRRRGSAENQGHGE